MTDRRQLSEQSRRYNAMIADAVMRAEAEGKTVRPAHPALRGANDCCPLGALNLVQGFRERYPATYELPEGTPWSFCGGFIKGFDGRTPGDCTLDSWLDGYYLGRLYRARALRMHGEKQ